MVGDRNALNDFLEVQDLLAGDEFVELGRSGAGGFTRDAAFFLE